MSLPQGGAWRSLHVVASDFSIYILGAHVALNWSWIVNSVKRLVARPRSRENRVPQIAQSANRAQKEA